MTPRTKSVSKVGQDKPVYDKAARAALIGILAARNPGLTPAQGKTAIASLEKAAKHALWVHEHRSQLKKLTPARAREAADRAIVATEKLTADLEFLQSWAILQGAPCDNVAEAIYCIDVLISTTDKAGNTKPSWLAERAKEIELMGPDPMPGRHEDTAATCFANACAQICYDAGLSPKAGNFACFLRSAIDPIADRIGGPFSQSALENLARKAYRFCK